MQRSATGAWTIVELLVVVGIIALLSGIVYAYLAPSRAKARQTVCTSNLHQIGIALQMYRSDYDGSDTGNSPADYGLPPGSFWSLLPYLGNNQDVLHCPAAKPEDVEMATNGDRHAPWSLYTWGVWTYPPSPSVPEWSEAIRRRGQEYPIIECLEHDDPPPDRPTSTRFVLILRINGNVTSRFVPLYSDGWTW